MWCNNFWLDWCPTLWLLNAGDPRQLCFLFESWINNTSKNDSLKSFHLQLWTGCFYGNCSAYSRHNFLNQIIYNKYIIHGDISRVFLAKLGYAANSQRCHQEWHQAGKFSKFVSLDVLKMHSLTLSVLRFFVKPFPNYLGLHYETLFFVDDF